MMKTSLIFKVCGLFLTVPGAFFVEHGADLKLEPTTPLSMLHGEYHVKDAVMANYRPTWASIWQKNEVKDGPNEMFQITLWPPKYCHAVYVCPLKETSYSGNQNFQTDKADVCEKEYIKYYPHIKKLLVKADGGDEQSKFWVKNRLEFDFDAAEKAKVHALANEPENYLDLKTAKLEKIEINLLGKELLILTNSRMCQVNKLGSKFYPLFRHGIQESKDGIYPEWFYYQKEYIKTDYLPSVKTDKTAKSIDLLAYLKEKTWSNAKIGSLKKTCQPITGWKAQGRLPVLDPTADQKTRKKTLGSFTRVSVNSYSASAEMSVADKTSVRTFSLNVENCHWFRMWVPEAKKMDEYAKDMKLSDTVDFFINEGFYVTPNSDIAIPLPGVNELKKFTFSIPHINPKDSYVDMTFGEQQGSPIYHDQFKLKAINENSFNLHIIKAPGCEIDLDARTLKWSDYDTDKPINHLRFGVCQFSYFN